MEVQTAWLCTVLFIVARRNYVYQRRPPSAFFLIKLSHNACLYLNVHLKYSPILRTLHKETNAVQHYFCSLNLSLQLGV
jgi:hypothetical protein